MERDEKRASTAKVILPCPSCGRSVTVVGRVRRVLCACGQILLEIGQDKVAPNVPVKVG